MTLVHRLILISVALGAISFAVAWWVAVSRLERLEQKALHDMAGIGHSASLFSLQNDRPPSSMQELLDFADVPTKDPWSNEYVLLRLSEVVGGVAVVSLGPDRLPNTRDDLIFWPI